MSDPDSIARVTAVLQRRVEDAIGLVVPGVMVRIGAPRPSSDGAKEASVFLYRVLPNAHARNGDLPTRSPGASAPPPPLALDLHYLISFASAEPFEDEIMLGRVASMLHGAPAIGAAELTSAAQAAALSRLPAEVPHADVQLDLRQERLSLDELLRLWAAFAVPIAPCLTYAVSLVLLGVGRPVPRRI